MKNKTQNVLEAADSLWLIRLIQQTCLQVPTYKNVYITENV